MVAVGVSSTLSLIMILFVSWLLPAGTQASWDAAEPGPGYRRVHGELTRLGYHLSEPAVPRILGSRRRRPGPRNMDTSWRAAVG